MEQHNWSLEEAVKSFLEDSFNNSSNISDGASNDFGMASGILGDNLDHTKSTSASTENSHTEGETSSRAVCRTRMIHFDIVDRDKTYPVVLPDSNTVLDIKRCLSVQLQLPLDDMKLTGWSRKLTSVGDNTKLRSLNLPQKNRLLLFSPYLNNREDCESKGTNDTNIMYNLIIRDLDTGHLATAYYPGSTNVEKVQHDQYLRSDVPSQHQIWSGWPNQVSNVGVTLKELGLCKKVYHLQVRDGRKQPNKQSFMAEKTTATTPKVTTFCHNDMSVDDEVSDTEDFNYYEDSLGMVSEDNVNEILSRSDLTSEDVKKHVDECRADKLVPSDLDGSDETACASALLVNFSLRYGANSPAFFVGSLKSAVVNTLDCSPRDRQPLAIYLHHDNSVFVHIFCSQV